MLLMYLFILKRCVYLSLSVNIIGILYSRKNVSTFKFGSNISETLENLVYAFSKLEFKIQFLKII